MKFSIQDFFSELVRIGKALMENVIYCTVTYIKTRKTWSKKCKKRMHCYIKNFTQVNITLGHNQL